MDSKSGLGRVFREVLLGIAVLVAISGICCLAWICLYDIIKTGKELIEGGNNAVESILLLLFGFGLMGVGAWYCVRLIIGFFSKDRNKGDEEK